MFSHDLIYLYLHSYFFLVVGFSYLLVLCPSFLFPSLLALHHLCSLCPLPYRPQFPSAAELDHNWVAYQWAVDCGLPHVSASLYTGMVDGRVLNSLTREDLKKYLKMSKKVEQLSFLTGVELLRMHDFRKEVSGTILLLFWPQTCT